MEKFKKFSLNTVEMKSITGGVVYSCHCEGTAGSWTGTYRDQAQADRAAAYWCTNGTDGKCTVK